MTTVISRVYSDEATADRVIEALSAEAWPAKWYEKIGGGKAAEDAIRAARVPESDVAAYAAMLTGGATMVVVRPEFNPRGAARRAMEIVDAEPSTPAPGVATQNAYIREKANPNLFNYGRILKDHPRFLSGDFKPGTGQRYALLSEAFYWRLLSEPKRRNSAMRPARFMSQKILPFPLLKDKAPSNSVISGGRRWLYNPLGQAPVERLVRQSKIRNWHPSRLPDLTGKTYVITGGNSGIGLEAARVLAHRGGDVVLACRSLEKAEQARAAIAPRAKGGLDVLQLDLSEMASVRGAAKVLRGRLDRIDGLVNNAGIMMTPQTVTSDGFDLQMATNHLGHFLWTALLLDLVEAAAGRVVVVSSIVHKMAPLNLDDLMTTKGYTPIKAYAQSKLANLMFAFELDRRLAAAGRAAICVACHPGYSATNLQSTGPTGFARLAMGYLNLVMAQSAAKGAVPTLLAAAGKEAERGGYYGPQNMSEARGPVSNAKVVAHALDAAKQKALWEDSVRLTGADFAGL